MYTAIESDKNPAYFNLLTRQLHTIAKEAKDQSYFTRLLFELNCLNEQDYTPYYLHLGLKRGFNKLLKHTLIIKYVDEYTNHRLPTSVPDIALIFQISTPTIYELEGVKVFCKTHILFDAIQELTPMLIKQSESLNKLHNSSGRVINLITELDIDF